MSEAATLVYVGVGANIEPEKHIEQGLRELAEQVKILGLSNFYETHAISSEHQPPFLNGVVKCETDLAARALKFDVLRVIEDAAGRQRTSDKFAPRTLDLDLLLYGDAVIAEEDLVVPDPDLRQRVFLAKCVLELAPGARLPGDANLLEEYYTLEEYAALRPAEGFTRKMRERFHG